MPYTILLTQNVEFEESVLQIGIGRPVWSASSDKWKAPKKTDAQRPGKTKFGCLLQNHLTKNHSGCLLCISLISQFQVTDNIITFESSVVANKINDLK